MTGRRLGTGLFLLLLINSCSIFCPRSGRVAVPAGSGPGSAVARMLAACDSANAGINLTVGGISVDAAGETHEVSTSARLLNPSDSTITWTTDASGSPGPLGGVNGSGKVAVDSAGDWAVRVEVPLSGGKTLTITGTIKRNSNPPPPCTGQGTWNIPGVGQGQWRF